MSPTVLQAFTLELFGTYVEAFLLNDGQLYLPVRQVAEALGLSFSPQLRRMKRDPVVGPALRKVQPPPAEEATWGGRRTAITVFPLRYLPGWLMGVQVSRLAPHLQARVLAYKREIAQLGWLAFQERLLPPEVRRWITEAGGEGGGLP